MPLDTQTQALIESMKQGGFKPASQIPLEASRTGLTQMAVTMAAPKVDVFASEDCAIAGPGGELAVRIYRHAARNHGETSPAVVFFHGGGMYLGDLDTH